MADEEALETGLNGALVRQVKAEKAAAGLTMEELAKLSGISLSSLSRYLNFGRNVNLGDTERLARALGMDVFLLLERAQERRE